MRPNITPGYGKPRQSKHSSTVDARVMKPQMAKHLTRLRSSVPSQTSTRTHTKKPTSARSTKFSNLRHTEPSSSRRAQSSRNRSSSGSRGRASESRKAKSREDRREYYSDSSDESSSEGYSEPSDCYSSEGDVATQLDDRGLVVNASDVSDCWSKVSIRTDEESAFQRFAKKVEHKEKQQQGFFFSSPQEEASLPSLETKGQTTFTVADTVYTDAYTEADTYTRADSYTEADTYTRADDYTEADTYTRADTYTEADTYTRADTYTEADTYTRADSYTEADAYTRADTYTEADTRTDYGKSYSDSDSDSEEYSDDGTRGAATYYTTHTQHTEAVQGGMWMCGAGPADDDTLEAQSYGGLRNNEVLIASSRTIATFEKREAERSRRNRDSRTSSTKETVSHETRDAEDNCGIRDSRPSTREAVNQYGRPSSYKLKTRTPKQSAKLKISTKPKKFQQQQQQQQPTRAATNAYPKRASGGMKLAKIEESQTEQGAHQSILAMPLQWWYGKTKEDEKVAKESRERMELAKRDLLVKPHLHVDNTKSYDGSLTLDARVRKEAEEGAWINPNPPAVHLDGRVKKVNIPDILDGKKHQEAPTEPAAPPQSAFAPKKTQKLAVWNDGDTEVESQKPYVSGQCKIEPFGATPPNEPNHEQQMVEPQLQPVQLPSVEQAETENEEEVDVAYDTVWVAPSAMSSRMSFESHQTLPTINTTTQSVVTENKAHHERMNSNVSNLINAFETTHVTTTPTHGDAEEQQIRARADWRVPGPLVTPVFPAPVMPSWMASMPREEGRHSPEQMMQTMDPEQMVNQQRCLFDDDERTEMTDEPSTILQLDENGQVGEVDPSHAFDTSILFLGSVQPVSASSTQNASSSTGKDEEYFGQFTRETLQSEPTATVQTTFKPRRRRNTTIKSFLSGLPGRKQKSNSSSSAAAAAAADPESYHQLDDHDHIAASNHHWGAGSTVASEMQYPDPDLRVGMDDMTTITTVDADYSQNDRYAQNDIVRDAMKSITGTEQLLKEADSFFAAGSFYEALDDGGGFSVD